MTVNVCYCFDKKCFFFCVFSHTGVTGKWGSKCLLHCLNCGYCTGMEISKRCEGPCLCVRLKKHWNLFVFWIYLFHSFLPTWPQLPAGYIFVRGGFSTHWLMMTFTIRVSHEPVDVWSRTTPNASHCIKAPNPKVLAYNLQQFSSGLCLFMSVKSFTLLLFAINKYLHSNVIWY